MKRKSIKEQDDLAWAEYGGGESFWRPALQSIKKYNYGWTNLNFPKNCNFFMTPVAIEHLPRDRPTEFRERDENKQTTFWQILKIYDQIIRPSVHYRSWYSVECCLLHIWGYRPFAYLWYAINLVEKTTLCWTLASRFFKQIENRPSHIETTLHVINLSYEPEL